MLKRVSFVFTIIAVLTLLVQGGVYQTGQASSPMYLKGKFTTVWGDGAPGSGETRISYFLSTTQFDNIQLIIDEGLLASEGGPITLNQKVVIVQGTWQVVGKSMLVQSLTLAKGETVGPEGIYGSQPWVSILCKFSDVPAEPNNLAYFQEMYSADYPGLDHYWQQQSYGLANLEGSGAFGWYVLPHPRNDYLPGGNLDWEKAAAECAAVADPYVDFSHYIGINLMFNDNLDCCAWGGGWYACLDGLCQTWRTTWEPPWGYQNIGVIAHETGHGFGLPHSLGNCKQGYDNRWDVLSDVWSNGPDPIYGTMGQHTISYHKEILEWFTPQQVFTSNTGTINTITLERLALPQTENPLEARVLINDLTNYFYTLEVRQPTNNPIDYDKWLPGFAVIIHEVATNRPEPAIVIDQDGDCNTGDAGAMYAPGEVFTDVSNGISVSINSATETGYVVTINNRFTTMESVDIVGADQGYISESIPFTATVNPSDATTPITYTWDATGLAPVVHVGDTVDSINFDWDELGTKAITMTASNAGGSVSDTHLIEIGSKIPIVSHTGPEVSRVGDVNVFTATVVPLDVVHPITYTWQASGQMPITHTAGVSDSVSYVWDEPGTQEITITAKNIFGSTSDHFSLLIRMPPTNLEVTGPEMGSMGSSSIFTATVDPITTTVPITYIWSVDGQERIIHTNGTMDTATFTWDYPGIHKIDVSAANQAGIAVDNWSIMVYVKIFLPIGLRN
jgi:hypothetical protein